MDFFAHVVHFHDFLAPLHMASSFLAWWALVWYKWTMGQVWSEKNGYSLSSLEISNQMPCKFSIKMPQSVFFETCSCFGVLRHMNTIWKALWMLYNVVVLIFFHLDPLKSSKLSLKNLSFWKWPIISSLSMNFKRPYLLIP